MRYLVLAICASVAVLALLKIAKQKKIKIEVAVAFNYIVASLLTFVFFKPNLMLILDIDNSWLFIVLGILLPSGFIIMGRAVEYAGIAKADAAGRLSLFLPIVASFTFLGQSLSLGIFIAILVAFLALFCLVYDNSSSSHITKQSGVYLLLVWFVYGICDIIFKLIAKQGSEFSLTLLVSFVLAGVALFAYLIYKNEKFNKNSILYGTILGVLNFANIIFYIKAHQLFRDSPSLVFTAMNIGVISLGILVGVFVFKEQLKGQNFLGLILGICAIVLLVKFS